jgi:cyclopropane-fatty-acyl-phospholipid synthase
VSFAVSFLHVNEQHPVPDDFFLPQVFPGGALPTVTLLVNSLARATSGRLVVDSISNIGPHYARTLRDWRRRFENNFSEIERALRKDHPGAFDSKQGDEQHAHELAVFRRKWLCKKISKR